MFIRRSNSKLSKLNSKLKKVRDNTKCSREGSVKSQSGGQRAVDDDQSIVFIEQRSSSNHVASFNIEPDDDLRKQVTSPFNPPLSPVVEEYKDRKQSDVALKKTQSVALSKSSIRKIRGKRFSLVNHEAQKVDSRNPALGSKKRQVPVAAAEQSKRIYSS